MYHSPAASHPRHPPHTYMCRSKPLQIWDKKVRNGHIKRITDQDIQSSVLEIVGTNVSTTFITCPADAGKTLGIKLPFLVMILKNLKKYFTFEVQVLDDKNVRRRFRASNYQSTTRVKPFICTMPMRLDEVRTAIPNLALPPSCLRCSHPEALRSVYHVPTSVPTSGGKIWRLLSDREGFRFPSISWRVKHVF